MSRRRGSAVPKCVIPCRTPSSRDTRDAAPGHVPPHAAASRAVPSAEVREELIEALADALVADMQQFPDMNAARSPLSDRPEPPSLAPPGLGDNARDAATAAPGCRQREGSGRER